MKKFLTILMALVITFFTVPFGASTVLADEKVYEDGDHKIDVTALEVDSQEKSGADGFLMDKATLSIDGDDIRLTFDYTKDFEMDYGINWTKLENNDPIYTNADDSASSFTFQINEIKKSYKAAMNYYVPGMPGDMGDADKGHSVDYRIVLNEDDLNNLPEKTEKEEPEKASDERVIGKLLTEKEADVVHQLNYDTDSRSTAGMLENPVKLLEKQDKKYIQIPISDSGAQYFRSLQINEKEVTWNSITEGPYTIQFELPKGIEEELDVSMVIQAGPNVMPHDNIKLWFDKDSLKTIKSKSEKVEIEQGIKTPIKANDTIIIKDSQDTQLTMPKDLPKNVNITVAPKKEIEDNGDLEVAGDVYEFNFENLGDNPGTFELTMGYDQDQYNSDNYDVDIYYFDGSEWIAQNGTVADGKVTVNVEHFSTYGVFAKEIEGPEIPEDPTENEDSKDDPKAPETDEETTLTPDKASEIDYVVKHGTNDETSAADGFFRKPGILLEKDGQKYLQLTIDDWDWIVYLKASGVDVDIVSVNKDGSATIQFKVDGDSSDAIALDMKIDVPGVYSQEHAARLFLDIDSQEDVDTSKYEVVVDQKDLEKPEFGKGGTNGDIVDNDGEKVAKVAKTDNPQTGDTTNIFLYAMLLLGSMIPLAVKFRRRFI